MTGPGTARVGETHACWHHRSVAQDLIADLFAPLLPTAMVWRQMSLPANMPQDVFERLYPLHAEEAQAVFNAVPKRQREFAVGRHCARAALTALVEYQGPVPVGPHRAPVWPAGVVGSITHDEGCCVAAVARRSDASGLGIDVEIVARLSHELEATICSAAERAALLARHGGTERLQRLALVFCAKEAFFKAQFPLTSEWFDFGEVEIVLPTELHGHFTARLLRAAGAFKAGQAFTGRCCLAGERAAAALVLPGAR